MTEPTSQGSATVYPIQCPSCSALFDAVAAELCQCLTQVNTPVCPQCGVCLCQLSKEDQRQFWSGAPEVMWQRRLALARATSSKGSGSVPPSLKRPLVLVADDEPTTRTLAARLLEKMGCGVVVATNGVEALEMARELSPDVVLSDALMPKLGGRELAKTLKEDPATASIRVILMTSIYTKDAYKTEAMIEYRCDGFLKKPVSADDLAYLVMTDLSDHP